ncbi:hypothetical protein M2S00_05615 [Apilactobacillus sp. TMW 2.2459]|uniref:hypothetical protein n=1 Tax=Apilactobacillus xinyiensis TaxID=2841032 RepID=UPI00200CA1DE|nr:hypothetical protein [Apilactobacillus xinyiensis]MCL0312582.1 hypothetical protein [Apilactobacillus xinyiensis]
MEINAKKMVDLLSENEFSVDEFATKQADLQSNAKAILSPLVSSMKDSIKSNEIKSCELNVTDLDAKVYLQNNIINLPFRYAKNIGKIIKDDDNLDISVYMIIESEDINRSKLRIDKLSSASQFIDQDFTDDFSKWLNKQLETIKLNKSEKEEKEDSK